MGRIGVVAVSAGSAAGELLRRVLLLVGFAVAATVGYLLLAGAAHAADPLPLPPAADQVVRPLVTPVVHRLAPVTDLAVRVVRAVPRTAPPVPRAATAPATVGTHRAATPAATRLVRARTHTDAAPVGGGPAVLRRTRPVPTDLGTLATAAGVSAGDLTTGYPASPAPTDRPRPLVRRVPSGAARPSGRTPRPGTRPG